MQHPWCAGCDCSGIEDLAACHERTHAAGSWLRRLRARRPRQSHTHADSDQPSLIRHAHVEQHAAPGGRTSSRAPAHLPARSCPAWAPRCVCPQHPRRTHSPQRQHVSRAAATGANTHARCAATRACGGGGRAPRVAGRAHLAASAAPNDPRPRHSRTHAPTGGAYEERPQADAAAPWPRNAAEAAAGAEPEGNTNTPLPLTQSPTGCARSMRVPDHTDPGGRADPDTSAPCAPVQ